MHKYDEALIEGMCYIVSDFCVTNNEGTYPLFTNRYKIVFLENTSLTPIDQIDNNFKSFVFVPFTYIVPPFITEADIVGMIFLL